MKKQNPNKPYSRFSVMARHKCPICIGAGYVHQQGILRSKRTIECVDCWLCRGKGRVNDSELRLGVTIKESSLGLKEVAEK